MKKFFCFFILFLSLCNAAIAAEITQPDFGPYMKDLQKSIKSNWKCPKGYENKRTVTLFTIDKSGKVSNVKVIQSGGPNFDTPALRAIELSSPVKPLPDSYSGQSVDVRFCFDYKVFGSSFDSLPKSIRKLVNPKQINNIKSDWNQSVKNINYPKDFQPLEKKVYKYYSKKIEQIIWQNMPKEAYPHRKTAEISLEINKDGMLKNISIITSSGSKSYDESILNSLKDCIFPDFPESLKKDYMKFDYRLDSAH